MVKNSLFLQFFRRRASWLGPVAVYPFGTSKKRQPFLRHSQPKPFKGYARLPQRTAQSRQGRRRRIAPASFPQPRRCRAWPRGCPAFPPPFPAGHGHGTPPTAAPARLPPACGVPRAGAGTAYRPHPHPAPSRHVPPGFGWRAFPRSAGHGMGRPAASPTQLR